MPLYIKNGATVELIGELAKRRGISKQDAIRLAVTAELKREDEKLLLREHLEKFGKDHCLREPAKRPIRRV